MIAHGKALGAVWSEPFFGALLIGGLATFADNRFVSLDCAFNVSYYAKTAFYFIVPFASIAIVLLVYSIIYLVRAFLIPLCFKSDLPGTLVMNSHKDFRATLRRKLLSQSMLAVCIVTFITYPAICIKVLDIFDCTVELDGDFFLNSAP